MIQFDKYTITENATIREALRKINDISSEAQMLFVVDANKKVIATLSDGDIRRGLIAGHELSESVGSIMFREFQFIEENDLKVNHIPELRKKGIQVVPILSKEGYLLRILNLNKQRSLLPIDAVIMAGGKGERLRPLTEKTPKPLLPVGDKAIIDHNVDRLIQYGVEHISVTTNYLAEQIESHYAKPHNEVQVQCVREPKFLGTMGAVRLVKKFYNNVVLVMNSDLFTDIDLEDMYLHFMEHKADMSIAAVPYTVSIPLGICDLDGRNVKGIIEKPTYNYYANAGIYMLRREVINMTPKNEFYNATDLIDALVKNGNKVIRYPLKGTWIDIGSMSEYQKARDLVKHMK
ncbi:sugar phosphate nucleotidyltransferase [Pseudobutyrivibrio sp.]|uniref:sugar phosphate nucleotidyltransferase n=1 Tax=Pseudobutyrivibrio sp. TaxID=2014367 RepID=UPI00386E5880